MNSNLPFQSEAIVKKKMPNEFKKHEFETNLRKINICPSAVKDVFLFGVEIKKIFPFDDQINKVYEMRKLRKMKEFGEYLKKTYCDDYLISGLIIYMKNPKDNYIKFYAVLKEKEEESGITTSLELIENPGDDACKMEGNIVYELEFKKKFSLKEVVENKSDKKECSLTTFYNISIGKLLKKIGYFKDRSTRRILYYKKEEVKKFKLLSSNSNLGYFNALKAVCETFEGNETYFKVLPRRLISSNETYQDILMNYKYYESLDKFKELVINKKGIKIYNNELFKIDDVELRNPYDILFELKDKTVTSVGEYFLNIYKTKLPNEQIYFAVRYVDQGGKLKGDQIKKLYVPLSLLYTVGNIKGDRINIKEIIQSPLEKHIEIEAIVSDIKTNGFKHSEKDDSQEDTKKIKFMVESGLEPLKVKAAVLDPPYLLFGKGITKTVDKDRGSFEVREICPISDSYSLNHILVLYFNIEESKAGTIYNLLLKGSQEMGIKMAETPSVVGINVNNTEDFDIKINELLEGVKERDDKNKKNKENFDCIFLFMDQKDKTKSYYSKFKKAMNKLDWKLPTQVVLYNPNKMEKGLNLSQFSNILSQILAKQGNDLFNIDFGFLSNTIVVSYSALTTEKSKTITSLCVSLGPTISSYLFFSEVKENATDPKISFSLKHLLKKALIYLGDDYKDKIKIENLIFYRDAVNEKMIRRVEEHEIAQINQALMEVNKDQKKRYNTSAFENTKYCFMLASKVCDVKLFQREQEGFYEGNVFNVPIGTLIEDTITKVNYQDFFLTSAHSGQGMNSPTHYTIIKDKTNLKAADIYKLTYYLTYLSYNTTKSIKVPAPLYFVTRRNKFTKEVLDSEKINDKLKYLNISL